MDLIISHPTPSEAPIALHGRFDAHASPAVASWLDGRLQDGAHHVSVDLSDVTFIDSTALGVLVQGMKRCRAAGGDLVIVRPSQTVGVILELTRLDRAFVIRGAALTGHPDA